MAITAADVMALRKATGLGMMACKHALTEAGGDIDKAKDTLRMKGLAKMDSRADRSSTEGKIAVAMADDQTKAAIVEIATETDFVAGNEAFAHMAQSVAQEALRQGPGAVQKTDVMQTAIDDVRLTTKENVHFNQGTVLGGPVSRVGSYVHFTGKIGVLIEVEGTAPNDQLFKDLCMHISAISPAPLGVTEDQIPAEVLEKERQIAKGQAIESGKPEHIAEKMVEGKIRKFLDEVVLLRQPFIKDDKQQVASLLPQGTTIKSFVRYHLGG